MTQRSAGSQEGPAVAPQSASRRPGFLGGAILVAIAAGAGLLERTDPDGYYRLVQEDEVVEWATVWLLLLASVAFARSGWKGRGLARLGPLLLALFCVGVAGEELSWGQRVLGVQPPEVFLEHNDQQELNLHNVLPKDLRKAALPAFLLGFGVLLPIVASAPQARRALQQVGLRAPTTGLALGFAAAGALYLVYPWRFTGEWVEGMLGAGLAWHALAADDESLLHGPTRGIVAIGFAVLLALGSAAWSREGRRIDPALVASARLELEALEEDFRRGSIPSACGLHKRLYRHLGTDGAVLSFHSLRERGLPDARADFLLDPWNSPYWIRDHCSGDGSRRVVVYSLGGNRLRESTALSTGGDDLAVVVGSARPSERRRKR